MAKRLGRKFIGIELNPEYAQIAREQIDGPLFAEQRGSDMTYKITQRERARLLRSQSPQRGGAQSYLYRLKCCMRATEDGYIVDVPDDLDQRLGRMLQTMGADDGGWQARVPLSMRNRWMRRQDPAPAELF